MDKPSTILIVDDDRVTREILRGLLEHEGHVIATVDNGSEALERAIELVPDLILLDVLMPGLDGYEVCRRLRADALMAEVPVIMLTALDDRDSRLEGMEAGADDFVSKPFDRLELLTRVRSITRLNRFRRLLQERSQLQRAEREVMRRVRELELLNEVITSAASTLDTPAVLAIGCTSMARAFAPAEARALLWLPESQRFRKVARATAVSAAEVSSCENLRSPATEFSLADLPWAASMLAQPASQIHVTRPASGLAVEMELAGAGSGDRPSARVAEGEASGLQLLVPILARGQLTGVIELGAAERAGFDELDEGLAESIATAVGQSVETAQLYQRLQRHADDLEVVVDQRTRELAAERDRIRAILEALGEAAFVTDIHGRVDYVNPAAVAMTGYDREEVVGLNFAHWHPDRRIERFFAQVRDSRGRRMAWEGELVARRKSGAYYDAVLTLAPLGDPEDPERAIGFVGVQRDITPLKEAERLKERFVSNVSHELRTPLSVITLLSGNLDAFGDRLEPAKQVRMIRDIRRQAQVLDELISDVLEISSIDSGRISPEIARFDIAPLLRDEIQRLQPLAERGEQILSADGPESLLVEGDAQQLRRVLRNLINNALKYSHEGGRIRCDWRMLEAGAAAASEWPGIEKLDAGRWAAVRVCDSGIGIDAEDLDRIFERFYRVNNQGSVPGTGLGLSITRELIGLHQGHLAVASEPDRGSIFAFYLPLPREDKPRDH